MVIMPISEEKKVEKTMTDMQFKAMLKMCLTMAENSKDAKEFKKTLAFPDNGFGNAFVIMLSRMVDSVASLDRVKQIIRDMIMMEMED